MVRCFLPLTNFFGFNGPIELIVWSRIPAAVSSAMEQHANDILLVSSCSNELDFAGSNMVCNRNCEGALSVESFTGSVLL